MCTLHRSCIGFIFIAIRNLTLVYSEYATKGDPVIPMVAYGIVTLIAVVLALTVLSSGVSGVGVNIAGSVNLTQLFFNPFNLLMILSVLLFSGFVAMNVFKVEEMRQSGIMGLPVGIALVCLVTSVYAPYMISNVGNNMVAFVVFLAMTALALVLSEARNRFAGAVAVLWLVAAILFYGILQYPYVFGGTVNITNYATNSATAGWIANITIICGALLVISLACLVYFAYLKKPPAKK